MRCYEWNAGSLQDGIFLSHAPALVLGSTSTDGSPIRVPLHKRNPASIENKRMTMVYPFWVNPQNGDPFLTLAKPHKKHSDDPRAFLHLSTRSSNEHAIQGFWRTMAGSPKTLLVGVGALDGKTWREGLIIMNPGDILRVRPEGSDDMWAIVCDDDTVHSETWIRHEARMLLREEGLLTS